MQMKVPYFLHARRLIVLTRRNAIATVFLLKRNCDAPAGLEEHRTIRIGEVVDILVMGIRDQDDMPWVSWPPVG